MKRTPDAKGQADILIKDLATMGFELQRGKALDLVAKLHGHRSWNQLASAEKGAGVIKGVAASSVDSPDDKVLGYAFPLPKDLFQDGDFVSDCRLAAYFGHKKDQDTPLLRDVDITGARGKTDVPFKELAVGEVFFDPDSGEDFVKTGATTAKILSYPEEKEGVDDEFPLDDVVERATYTLQLSGILRYRVTHNGEVKMVSSPAGLTADMKAILDNRCEGTVEELMLPWFEWVDAYEDAIGEPFSELPADPKQAIEKYLKPHLPK